MRPVTHISNAVGLPNSGDISGHTLLLTTLTRNGAMLAGLLSDSSIHRVLGTLATLKMDCALSTSHAHYRVVNGNNPLRTRNTLRLFLNGTKATVHPLTTTLYLNDGSVILANRPHVGRHPVNRLISTLHLNKTGVACLRRRGCPPLHLRNNFANNGISISNSISDRFLATLLVATPLTPRSAIVHVGNSLISGPCVSVALGLVGAFNIRVRGRRCRRFIMGNKRSCRSPNACLIRNSTSSTSCFLTTTTVGNNAMGIANVKHGDVRNSVHFTSILRGVNTAVY